MEVQVRESKHPYSNNTNFEVWPQLVSFRAALCPRTALPEPVPPYTKLLSAGLSPLPDPPCLGREKLALEGC